MNIPDLSFFSDQDHWLRIPAMLLLPTVDIPITTPALLFPAIAILMLGYINRYQGTAGVIRAFKSDYDKGYKRVELTQQVRILKKRIELSRYMLLVGATALMLACISMFLIFAEQQRWGNYAFGLSIIFMIVSLFLSIAETTLSNKSLIIEADDILSKEKDQS